MSKWQVLASVIMISLVGGMIAGYTQALMETVDERNQVLKEQNEIKEELIEHSELNREIMLAIENDEINIERGRASAYSPFDDRNGINSDGNPEVTSTGTRPDFGTFAVDPSRIPYGSEIIVVTEDEIHKGKALDTGGAMRSAPDILVDIFHDCYDKAMEFEIQDAIIIWQ